MKITLRSMEVEDCLGYKLIGGAFATQEVFEVDMLNRILVQLCAQRRETRVEDFMQLQHETALKMTNATAFDEPTQRAFEACVAAQHPVLALSLLRLARTELQLLQLCQQEGFGERAYKDISEYYRATDAAVYLAVNGEKVGGSERLFEMDGAMLLCRKPDLDWYFSEFLNVPYAVEAGLLFTGQLILAKCYAVRDLYRMLHLKQMDAINRGDNVVTERFEQIRQQIDADRYACLKRQIQHCCVALSGAVNVQHGLPRREAVDILHPRPKAA